MGPIDRIIHVFSVVQIAVGRYRRAARLQDISQRLCLLPRYRSQEFQVTRDDLDIGRIAEVVRVDERFSRTGGICR